MPNGDHQNDKHAVIYLVDDSIVADTNTPSVSAAEFFDAGRSWIVSKGVDSRDYAVAVWLRDACQLLLGSPLDEKLILQSRAPSLISETACSKGIASEGSDLA